MRLVFALSYGGRLELVEAARRMLRDADLGRLTADALSEKLFAQYLDEPEMPDVDLLIRTGGEYRVSNFLLWQIAYAEIFTSDAMWPDFDRAHFPTVAIDKSRLRTIVTAAHADEQLDLALAAFDRVGHELGLISG